MPSATCQSHDLLYANRSHPSRAYIWLPHRLLISGLLSVQLCPASVCFTLCPHAHTLVLLLCLFPAEKQVCSFEDVFFLIHTPLPPHTTTQMKAIERACESNKWTEREHESQKVEQRKELNEKEKLLTIFPSWFCV